MRDQPALAFLCESSPAASSGSRTRRSGALVVLGAPEAGGVLRRCLRSNDAEIRAQAIEALDSTGDRRLSGALVRLLEDDVGDAQDRDAVVRALLDDDDPWIVRLTRRPWQEGRGCRRRVAPSATSTRCSCSDGCRCSSASSPRTSSASRWPPRSISTRRDAAIVHEGELGDELVVIVEGSVRVVHVEPDGSERLIRRYDAGDHIGELAVLREAPRAATVIAEGDGVRGLVIGGAGLRAILRERPEAAMAMLATLAERIGTQQ